MSAEPVSWPHAPVHRLAQNGTFMVISATYLKHHHFRGARRQGVICRGMLKLAVDYGWQLEAWAVFSNHYHFVGHSPVHCEGAGLLSLFLQKLHATTGSWINRLDGTAGRRVWHNYWDTRLTFERSYLARLSFVHQNAMRHGLVRVANQYPWCSTRWFEWEAIPSQVKTVYRLTVDRVSVMDDYEVADDW